MFPKAMIMAVLVEWDWKTGYRARHLVLTTHGYGAAGVMDNAVSSRISY